MQDAALLELLAKSFPEHEERIRGVARKMEKAEVLLELVKQHVLQHDGSEPGCLKCFVYEEIRKLVGVD